MSNRRFLTARIWPLTRRGPDRHARCARARAEPEVCGPGHPDHLYYCMRFRPSPPRLDRKVGRMRVRLSVRVSASLSSQCDSASAGAATQQIAPPPRAPRPQPPRGRRPVEPGVGNIDFFAFDTHATNSIPMCSAEYADHNGAIGTLNTQRIAYKCPSEVTTFFHSLRAQAQRVPHKADS